MFARNSRFCDVLLRFLLGFTGLLTACTPQIGGESAPTLAPDAIVSTSLCADSYILALAPARAAALSWQSRSALSRATPAQKALPQLSADPERLAPYREAFVLLGSGERSAQSAKHYILKWGEDFETVWENMTALEAAWDVSDEAQNSLKSRLDSLPKLSSAPKILYLTRSGGSAGPGTFVDTVINAAGGQNLMQTQGWLTLTPEEIITLTPDIILRSFSGGTYAGVSDRVGRHSAVTAHLSEVPQIEIDGALWPCAGPSLVEATETLNHELRMFLQSSKS